jgi:tRNA(Met) C34 N-acetyltransferase TmcA
MMSLFVSSHYKNSPNDLQLMSDAPGHQMFVLIGAHPSATTTTTTTIFPCSLACVCV